MNFIKRLLCKHDYEYDGQHKINAGMGKIIYYKCKKCEKVKVKII